METHLPPLTAGLFFKAIFGVPLLNLSTIFSLLAGVCFVADSLGVLTKFLRDFVSFTGDTSRIGVRTGVDSEKDFSDRVLPDVGVKTLFGVAGSKGE